MTFYQTILIGVLFIIHVSVEADKQTCEPISSSLTSPKIGKKSWDKCVEYQEQLIYPCEKGPKGQLTRSNYCNHKKKESQGITQAENNEFPHMAFLGYGDNVTSAEWRCGGALISDRFVLVTGQCAFMSRMIIYGPAKYVMLGTLKARNEVKDNIYKIKNIIRHPDYLDDYPFHNDIALIETEKQVKLDQNTVPACLPIDESMDSDSAYSTSYDLFAYKYDDTSNVTLKAFVTKTPVRDCSYQYGRYKGNDYNESIQLCYGNANFPWSNCKQNNGEGPLQIQNKNISCMYTVIGLSSLSPPCRYSQPPEVYAKVSHYLSWIENIVWPDNEDLVTTESNEPTLSTSSIL